MKLDQVTKKISIIKAISKHGNQSRAARDSGISRQTIRLWLKDDSAFYSNYQRALKQGLDWSAYSDDIKNLPENDDGRKSIKLHN